MSGFELSGLIRFLTQAGVAVAGAACLWGFVLAFKNEKKLADFLMWPFLAGFFVFAVNWFIAALVFFPAKIFGHEGIAISSSEDFIIKGIEAGAPFVFGLIVLTLLSSFLYFRHRKIFQKYAAVIFFLKFIAISVITLTGVYIGQWDRFQAFFSFHGWHSILTLGTVIMVDFLYALSLHRKEFKKAIYQLFFYMSSAIWIGLGIDFISAFLIIEEAFEINTQFIFIQMVVGIIIINGALLSGPVMAKLMNSVHGKGKISPALNNFFAVLGSISIVSWLTITFLDFFGFGFSFLVFTVIYASAIIFVFLSSILARRIGFE